MACSEQHSIANRKTGSKGSNTVRCCPMLMWHYHQHLKHIRVDPALMILLFSARFLISECTEDAAECSRDCEFLEIDLKIIPNIPTHNNVIGLVAASPPPNIRHTCVFIYLHQFVFDFEHLIFDYCLANLLWRQYLTCCCSKMCSTFCFGLKPNCNLTCCWWWLISKMQSGKCHTVCTGRLDPTDCS